ncbi:peptide chain release factor 2 [bacterium]|nr:peptide chain release factor 2 [bacterium]
MNWKTFGGFFDLENKTKEINKLSKELEQEGFWQDVENAKKVMKKLDSLKETHAKWDRLHKDIEDAGVLYELAKEEDDKGVLDEVSSSVARIDKEIEKWQLEVLLAGKYDKLGCFLSIKPGAGGTESCDWAQMLLRMYTRWAERNNMAAELVDVTAAEEAGIKYASLRFSKEFSYGYLKGEKGIHRLVRVSPFDAQHRRHTSFASVEVIPKIDEEFKLDIKDVDLRIDTFRSSGPGGQHVNMTDSAVRITHLPTKIVAQAQSEKSQHQNKFIAMELLMSRLYSHFQEIEKEKQKKIFGEKQNIQWGSQARSYVLYPYTLVKDHRTGTEQTNAENVLDGDIDPFIFDYLRNKKTE